jgi:hypothetical protein
MTGVLFNAILSCFKHPMQLSHGLLHVIHMKVHNEWLIAHREQLKNHVIIELATKLVQGLNIIYHLDHMMIDQTTLCQLTRKHGF